MTEVIAGRSAKRKQRIGARLLLFGGLLVVIGIALLLLVSSAPTVGLVLAVIGVPPTVIGIVLLGIAAVESHATRERPFA